MAYRYTAEEVYDYLNKKKLTYSQADKKLISANPDLGMEIAKLKYDYMNAATDEERAKYNNRANAVRAAYGYDGGEDGMEGRFPYSEEFAYKDNAKYKSNLKAPSYEDTYKQMYEDLLSDISQRKEFSYDPEEDVVFRTYQNKYTREGRRAAEDTMGTYAALTGGRPSSYAVSAASQAANSYAAALADKIPELYEQAYKRYSDENERKHALLEAVRTLALDEYEKYTDELAQYNRDRDFEYGVYKDEYARLTGEYDRLKEQDSEAYERYMAGADTDIDEKKLAQSREEWEFDKKVKEEELKMKKEEHENSLLEFELDYKAAKEKNDYDMQKRMLDLALEYYELGDPSYLEKLGIDVDEYEKRLSTQEESKTKTKAQSTKTSGESEGEKEGDADESAPDTFTKLYEKMYESENPYEVLFEYMEENGIKMSSASSYINHYEEWKEAKDSKKGNIPISWTIKNMHLSTSGMTTNNVDYVEKMLNGINELINSGAVTLEDAIVILTEYAKTKEISNDRIAKKRMRVLIDELKTRTKT